MPERRLASLVPETTTPRPRVPEWGTSTPPAGGGFLAQDGSIFEAQDGSNLVPQGG